MAFNPFVEMPRIFVDNSVRLCGVGDFAAAWDALLCNVADRDVCCAFDDCAIEEFLLFLYCYSFYLYVWLVIGLVFFFAGTLYAGETPAARAAQRRQQAAPA